MEPTSPPFSATPAIQPVTQRAREDEEPLVPPAASSLDVDHRAKGAALDAVDTEAGGGTAITGGDVDVEGTYAETVGDEAPGGDNPTPDQDVVDLIGRSLGVEYADDEELRGADKIVERDRHRWELDPASAEDYKERSKKDGA